MHSFSAMGKVEKKNNKNTSPRTAPAMSCSRLKILFKSAYHLCQWFENACFLAKKLRVLYAC